MIKKISKIYGKLQNAIGNNNWMYMFSCIYHVYVYLNNQRNYGYDFNYCCLGQQPQNTFFMSNYVIVKMITEQTPYLKMVKMMFI